MARGRKKGGFKIDTMNEKDELIKAIINQANSINKKKKKFNDKGISEYETFLETTLTAIPHQRTKTGGITKSKTYYGEFSPLYLKKMLSVFHKINNSSYYGTPKKYEQEVTKSLKGFQDFTKKHFVKKGYSENFINDVIFSKDLYDKIYDSFNEGFEGYESSQVIDKVSLNYNSNTGFSKKEIERILSDIEYSKNKKIAIEEYNRRFEEFEEAERNKRLR